MPTKDMTTISAKVRTDEKALFELLCETDGITASKAIRSFIMDCNGQSTISDRDARYMARYGISQMI